MSMDFEEIEEIKKVSKKNYEVSARTSIDEFEEKIGIKLKIDKNQEIDTLGGFIFFLFRKNSRKRRGN